MSKNRATRGCFGLFRISSAAAVALGASALFGASANAAVVVATNFAEYGKQVNGYQDDFNAPTFDPAWTAVLSGVNQNGTAGQSVFTLPGTGSLHMVGGNGDPNKLLLNGAYASGAAGQPQEVLARITVNSSPSARGDGWRGGITVGSNVNDLSRGINLLFRPDDQNQGGAVTGPGFQHFNFLNDAVAWGPVIQNGGQVVFGEGQAYWLRLRLDPNAAPGSNNLADGNADEFAKIWLADGVTPEPAGFQGSWVFETRAGLAGLTANSLGGGGIFDVDYVLIKAAGLPQITAGVDAPEPGTVAVLVVVSGAALARRRRR